MDYILFIAQQANFQSRSMLIPVNAFLSVEKRKRDYEILLEHSLKDVVVRFKNEDYIIKNLLLQDYVSEGNRRSQIVRDYTRICNELKDYADGMDEDCLEDKDWYDNAIMNICKGFNHIKNYKECLEKVDGINIVDSFFGVGDA